MKSIQAMPEQIEEEDRILADFEQIDVKQPEEAALEEVVQAEEAQDQVGEMPEVLESASQIKPSPSQISNMSGRTYIS